MHHLRRFFASWKAGLRAGYKAWHDEWARTRNETTSLDSLSPEVRRLINTAYWQQNDASVSDIINMRQSHKFGGEIPPLCEGYGYECTPDRTCTWIERKNGNKNDASSCLRCIDDIGDRSEPNRFITDVYDVHRVVCLESGQLASSCYYVETIRLWNPITGECTNTLVGHTLGVYCMVQLQSGLLASGGEDNTIRLWDVTTGVCMNALIGHTDSVCHLVQLQQSGLLASAGLDNTIRLWDVTTGECMNTLIGHTDDVLCMVQLTSPGLLASGSRDNTIRLWSQITGECTKTLTGHTEDVLRMVQLTSGLLASASYDKTIRLWNPTTGECTEELTMSESATCMVGLASGGLALGFLDGQIGLWDPESKRLDYQSIHTGHVTCMVQLQSGHLASGSEDKTIVLWDVDAFSSVPDISRPGPLTKQLCTSVLRWHTKPVICMVQNGSGLVSCDGITIAMWMP